MCTCVCKHRPWLLSLESSKHANMTNIDGMFHQHQMETIANCMQSSSLCSVLELIWVVLTSMSTTTAILLVLQIKLQQRHIYIAHYCLGYLDNLILSFHCYRTEWWFCIRPSKHQRPPQSSWVAPGSWSQPRSTGQGEDRTVVYKHWECWLRCMALHASCETRSPIDNLPSLLVRIPGI